MKVLLLHAMPLDGRMWEPQLEALAGYDVEAPTLYELPGNSVAGWAAGLLEQHDGELALVGSSLGGYVSLELIRQAPERVRGALLAGSRIGADTPERRVARDEAIAKLRAEGVAAWAPSAPAQPPPQRTVDEIVRTLQAIRDRADATELARAYDGVLWLAVGDDDPFFPLEEAQAFAASAPRVRLEVFEGTGHFPSRDRAERFNELLLEFLTAVA